MNGRPSFLLSMSMAVFLASLAGCDRLALDLYWRSERYVLIAIDSREQMDLCFDRQDGTVRGLVGPTVFAVGADDKYIVIKQHPRERPFGPIHRTITNYFVVKRTTSPRFSDRLKGIQGPMTKEEFDRLVVSLHLPPFSKTFKDLQ